VLTPRRGKPHELCLVGIQLEPIGRHPICNSCQTSGNLLLRRVIAIASCRSADSERSHRCYHLQNKVGTIDRKPGVPYRPLYITMVGQMPFQIVPFPLLVNTWGEVTSLNLWPRCDRHFVGITWHNV